MFNGYIQTHLEHKVLGSTGFMAQMLISYLVSQKKKVAIFSLSPQVSVLKSFNKVAEASLVVYNLLAEDLLICPSNLSSQSLFGT